MADQRKVWAVRYLIHFTHNFDLSWQHLLPNTQENVNGWKCIVCIYAGQCVKYRIMRIWKVDWQVLRWNFIAEHADNLGNTVITCEVGNQWILTNI